MEIAIGIGMEIGIGLRIRVTLHTEKRIKINKC